MSVWAIIPIKAPEACKSRLRGALSDEARRALVRRMLHNVVGAAEAAPSVEEVMLLGPHRHGLPPSTPLLADAGEGLNAALTAAAQSADANVRRLLFIAADLPLLAWTDVEALAAIDDGVAIAPDRSGQGTNALSLPVSASRDFRFQFGAGSFAKHSAEAARLSLPLRVIRSDTLALDIDAPDDLSAIPELLGGPAPSSRT